VLDSGGDWRDTESELIVFDDGELLDVFFLMLSGCLLIFLQLLGMLTETLQE
jgi:hypothetical protein